MARWHTCNVYHDAPDARRLWQFDARKKDFPLTREHSVPADQQLPGGAVEKSWSMLWQPKLNVAWLPSESVFLRVAHLPPGSFAETLSMVELQLEKLSPIPVGQVVWTIQLLGETPPKPVEGEATAAGLQTVVVILAERKMVEEFLGKLEGQGFLADRLELRAFDQLQATSIAGNGAWIYPGATGTHGTALVAWWYDGVLQNVNFVSMPATGDRTAALKEQLAQMAWAGELEGWLTSPPEWHLVADEASAIEWESPLRQAVGQPVQTSMPVSEAELAALTAKRATRADAQTNLLPQEFVVRYRSQFIDRLWLRGLMAVGSVYLVAVLIYFATLSVQSYRVSKVEDQVAGLSQTYTNTVRLKELYQVLKVRQDLKFAALDCWKAVAERLPDSAQLDSLSFQDGRKLALAGTAPADKVGEVLDFNSSLRKATVNGEPLFHSAGGDAFSSRTIPPGNTVGWNFSLELKRVEGL